MDRVGNCDFTFVAGERQLRHRVSFNTTEPRMTSWLNGKSHTDLFTRLQWNKVWIYSLDSVSLLLTVISGLNLVNTGQHFLNDLQDSFFSIVQILIYFRFYFGRSYLKKNCGLHNININLSLKLFHIFLFPTSHLYSFKNSHGLDFTSSVCS